MPAHSLRKVSLLLLALFWSGATLHAADRPTPAAGPAGPVSPKIGAVTTNANAAALAQYITGPGVTINNASYRGAANAAGFFASAQASIGFNNGVVLSTGEVLDVIGPNTEDGRSGVLGTPGDSALDALVAPHRTQDAAILEFDLITPHSTISIPFVFASEEYNEFVNSEYNDVVAIFVNGINCANFNGRPVAVNTINSGSNPSMYIDNTTGTRNTQMDGLTVPLNCVAAVNPNTANRVRIAIADTSDAILDAAVFVPQGGITAPASGAITSSDTLRVVEYFHPEFGHYFVTAIPAEIASLDTGALSKDWVRTDRAFDVYVSGYPGSAPVCRFFSASFAPKSSHFYTPDSAECDIVKTNPAWTFEAEVFNVILPSKQGACPVGTKQLYRMYNDGMSGAPNHRYTTDFDLRAQMLANGWIAEGEGIGIVGCLPV